MKKIILASILSISCFTMAEDIELYVGSSAQRSSGKAKVLIIFDNSGSMESNKLSAKTPYNANTVYPAIGDLQITPNEPIYFTKGAGIDDSLPIPDGPNERRRFLRKINGCESSKAILDSVGFYTGYLREYKYQGNSGAWKEIPDNNGLNIDVLDCYADIQNNDNKNANGMELGFPVDGLGTNQNPVYYGPSSANSPVFNTGELVTLYTSNYLRWAQADISDIGSSDLTRLEVAQNTISDFIVSNPTVDFGLQVFNVNAYDENEKDGGRIVFGIQNMDVNAKATILDIINNQIDGETNTPLCESLYEAGRYFGGKSVYYGDDDGAISNGYKPNTPPRDRSIESGKKYITPFVSCTKEIYTILITDGNPTKDNAANDEIKLLHGVSDSPTVYSSVIDGKTQKVSSYLAQLAYYMQHHDLIDGSIADLNIDGTEDLSTIRNSTLNTIGFGFVDPNVHDYVEPPGVKLLKDAATKGGGEYYAANDPSQLKNALNQVIFEISKSHGSFTAPAVATNNFDRTKTLDSIYYAMFQPDNGPRWAGNLKKLKVTANGIVDQTNQKALDDRGTIVDGAKTIWSKGAADGNEVAEGGVAQMLRTKTPRKFLSDVKLADGVLLPLTRASALNSYSTTALLADELQVVDDVDHKNIDDMLAWAKGTNVDQVKVGDSIPTIRPDVFGDPLHSKPIIINYGNATTPDIRILIGTNAGVLHMFKDLDTSVDEAWAYMPKEFLKNIKTLRDNFPSSDKVYGIDGSATVYISDGNGDGVINGNDKAWVFFGLRRGGISYYALDVTKKDAPKFMWKIDGANATDIKNGFQGMGQSWSQPHIAFSKINVSGSTAKPVLIFGAGYSTGKDNSGVGMTDSVGKGIFMVDAESGSLLWRMHTESGDMTTLYSGTDSIPSKIASLDSDADGFVDRLYAGDTGGNVWRVDMPGIDIAKWSAIKLASFGSDASGDNLNDRRFFNQPSIVRALITKTVKTTTTKADGSTSITVDRFDIPYDAILLGSGDVTNPIGTDTADKFFMIKDENVVTQTFDSNNAPDVLSIANLKDYTLNPFKGLTGDALLKEQLDASSKAGWYISFDEDSGEKSTASAAVISGVAYFNSFTPASNSNDNQVCSIQSGGASLYAVDLSLGINVYDWRKIITGYNPPGEPTFVTVNDPNFVPDPANPDEPIPQVVAIIAPDVVPLCVDGNCDTGTKTMRTYLYTSEN
jgi:type IV pilus assembly protein PilY1